MDGLLPYSALALTTLASGSVAVWYRHSVQRLVREAGAEGERADGLAVQLQAARAAHASNAADLQGRLQELDAALAEFRDANSAYSEQNDQLRQLVDARTERVRRLEADLATLRARAITQVRHMVILDGMPNSGKTTFVERIVNPMATPEQLRNQASTVRPYHTGPVPIGWEVKDDRMALHTLQFWDIAGENPAGLIDVLNELARERASPSPQETVVVGRAVALTLWNSAVSVEDNLRFLSPARIHTIFGARITRQILTSIVVFFNKADFLEDRLRNEGGATIEAALARQEEVVRGVVFEKILDMYPDLTFSAGSALTGAGVHAAMGEIVKGLGISHLFTRADEANGVITSRELKKPKA